MSDLIERQSAIDTLAIGKEFLLRVLDDMDTVGQDREKYSWGLGLIESSIDDIEELPSAQQWIPMAEKRPEPWQQCWFTNVDGEVEQHHFDGLVSRYKAWMPFVKPKPWKGGAE